MAAIIKTTISKTTLLLLFGLCLGVSSTLYAAQNDEVDDEKQENTDPNAPHGPQNDKKQIVASWACPKCTFLNKANSKCCEICNANKPLPDEKHAIWSCSVCTLENTIEDTKCVACKTANPEWLRHKQKQPAKKKFSAHSLISVDFIKPKAKNSTTSVLYSFTLTFNNSACEISHTYNALYAIHKDIIKTYKKGAKRLVFPSKNISKNYLQCGNQLQLYLRSLFSIYHQTKHEGILDRLGISICDLCKALNKKHK